MLGLEQVVIPVAARHARQSCVTLPAHLQSCATSSGSSIAAALLLVLDMDDLRGRRRCVRVLRLAMRRRRVVALHFGTFGGWAHRWQLAPARRAKPCRLHGTAAWRQGCSKAHVPAVGGMRPEAEHSSLQGEVGPGGITGRVHLPGGG